MIREFYAVTATSIYHAVSDDHGRAIATKIAVKGHSRIPVGNRLERGTMIAIRENLVAYDPGITGRPIELVNTKDWGGHSSAIVALFLEVRNAARCFQYPDPRPYDERWLEETKKVVAAIGENHPAFYVDEERRHALAEA
ncbi:hypothetical protein M1432_00105 [Patescibacteria group bacterium]|nr:hypothetical protein [Patescibacteria group bacterium]